MRAKVDASKKAVTRPISLFPHQKAYAVKRSFGLNLSLSRYVQTLIDIDRKHNLVAKHLADVASAQPAYPQRHD